jgi:hypothetical protein
MRGKPKVVTLNRAQSALIGGLAVLLAMTLGCAVEVVVRYSNCGEEGGSVATSTHSSLQSPGEAGEVEGEGVPPSEPLGSVGEGR